jgi:hypothetical protein
MMKLIGCFSQIFANEPIKPLCDSVTLMTVHGRGVDALLSIKGTLLKARKVIF